jgi:hypothetical protein
MNKKIRFIIGVTLSSLLGVGCASVEKLEQSPRCEVWEEQKLVGPRYVEFEGPQMAKYTGKCWIPGILFCKWVRTEYEPHSRKVLIEGNSLFEGKRIASEFKNNKMKFEKSFADNFVKSSDAEVNMKDLSVKRTVTIVAFGLNKGGEEKVRFNKACNPQQAAIGAVALWAGRSKDAGQ